MTFYRLLVWMYERVADEGLIQRIRSDVRSPSGVWTVFNLVRLMSSVGIRWENNARAKRRWTRLRREPNYSYMR